MFHSRRETTKRGAVSRRLVNEEMLNEEIQEGGIDSHTMRDLVASIRVVGTEDFVCEEVRAFDLECNDLVDLCLLFFCLSPVGGGTNSARHEIRVCEYVPYRDRLVQRLRFL